MSLKRDALIVFMVALAARLLYLVSAAGDPWLQFPIVDEIDYRSIAVALLHGGANTWPAFYPPGWPLVLAGWYGLFGDAVPFWTIRILTAVLGSVSIVFSYWIALRLFKRQIALIGSLIAAVAGVLVHLHTSALATSLFMCLLSISILISLKTVESNSNKHNPAKSLLTGFLWGLTTVVRPIALVPAAVTILWMLLATHRQAQWRNVVSLIILIAGMLIAILPISALNLIHGDPALISTNGGVNFWFGNNEYATGYSPYHPELGQQWVPEQVVEFADLKSGTEMTAGEASGWFYRQGLQYWLTQPLDATLLWLKKTLLVLGAPTISNNSDLWYFATQRILLRILMAVGWWWIMPLALVGIVVVWKYPGIPAPTALTDPKLVHDENSRLAYVVTLIATYLLTVTAFFVTSRYRAPVLPLLAPFAVVPVAVLAQRIHNRTKIVIGIAGVTLLLVLNVAPRPLAPSPNLAYGHVVHGYLYRQADRPAEALEHFEKALQLNPRQPLAHLYSGDVARKIGDHQNAIRHYRAENKLQPVVWAEVGMGYSWRALGVRDSALAAFKRAFQLQPDEAAVRRAYAEELGEQALQAGEQSDFIDMIDHFERARELMPQNPFFSFGIAQAHWLSGDTSRANSIVDSLLAEHPDFPPARQWKKGWRP